MARKAKINRKTKETNIAVEANIDGKGSYKIDTKIGFLNHMLEQLSISYGNQKNEEISEDQARSLFGMSDKSTAIKFCLLLLSS